MKRISIVLFSILMSASFVAAQDAADTTKRWTRGGIFSLNFSQLHLSNWIAGGQSSHTALSRLNLFNNYAYEKNSWDNSIDLAYGLVKQQTFRKFIKTDDRIELTSKYSRYAFKEFHYSLMGNFRSQFSAGYNYPNDSVKFSDFMSPAYVLLALGLDFKPNKELSVFLSPVTGKFTIVKDQGLANAGAFGVDPAVYDEETGALIRPGENLRKELGAYLKGVLNKDVTENILLQVKLDLFSNYLNNPQNIDVSWENMLAMKVNKYITTTISTHLIYDHDIDIPIDTNEDGTPERSGPRTQFKELLMVGVSFKL